jgi:predicted nucleotidyltransferase component of viral defense system
MVILPIEKKLRKKIHKQVALAQDILILEVYNIFPKAIIHGDTAIWRCYGSNRFSEDVDFYFPLEVKERLQVLTENLKKRGFIIEKFKRTNNTIFAKFSYLNTSIRLEAVFKKIKNYVTKNFEMSDGTFILVNTLSPEEMILEKISAYKKRKKVRDLYDIFFLLKFVENKEKIKEALKDFLEKFEKPEDEKELKVLIISGSIPNVESMVEVMRAWVR